MLKAYSLLLAFLCLVAPATAELIRNGDFSAGSRSWELERIKNAEASMSVSKDTDGSAFVRVVTPVAATAGFHVQLVQRRLTLEQGRKYRVTFRARGEPAVRISANVKIDRAPWQNLWTQPINLETGWKTYSYTFIPSQSSDIARLTFTNLGGQPGRYDFANVSVVAE